MFNFNEYVGWFCLAMVSYSSLYLTVFADVILDSTASARAPTEAEAERLGGALSELRQKAADNRMPIPRSVRFRVIDTEEINALAYGYRSVAVTSGLLDVADARLLNAVLAHELGHHVTNDTLPILKMIAGFGPAMTLTLIGAPILAVLSEASEPKPSSIGLTLEARAAASLIGSFIYIAICCFVLTVLFVPVMATLLFRLCKFFLSCLNQPQEYRADEYAIRLTQDDALLVFLEMTWGAEAGSEEWYRPSLWLSHPPTERRIERGRALLDEMTWASGPIRSV
ncbi:peptidase, M48 family [Rhodobacteraceae bacterium KLH11]|nr:peptidase, M48 family [Rhodobacteraceae bacterium KLH11]